MMTAGNMYTLTIVETGQGIQLRHPDSGEIVILDERTGPTGLHSGDTLDVFVYRRDEDRWIGSRHKPYLMPGEIGTLEVAGSINAGTFFDWGLAGDLFMPVQEQRQLQGTLQRGQSVLLGVTLSSETGNVIGTLNIYDLLSAEAPYGKSDSVQGVVYELNPERGAFVAVDNRFHGLIPLRELYGSLKIGQTVDARVGRIRDDGKLELSLREESHVQMDADSQRILEKLTAAGGQLALHDKSDPQKIRDEFQMSKAAFKRAIGRLWKEGKIVLQDDGIQLP